MAPTLFDYTNYRDFLRDRFDALKAQNAAWSHRMIAQKLGFKSSGHFAQILNSKLRLGGQYIKPLAELLGLSAKEERFFELLVHLNQARTERDQRYYLREISVFQEAPIAQMSLEQYEFYRHWYYAALRELLFLREFKPGEEAEMGRLLCPQVSETRVKKALRQLHVLEIVDLELGYYRPLHRMVSTGLGARSKALDLYVENFAKLASQSPQRFGPGEKFNSWIALSASEQCYQQMIEEIRLCRRKIMDLIAADSGADRVYHFNMHLFPLSEKLPS